MSPVSFSTVWLALNGHSMQEGIMLGKLFTIVQPGVTSDLPKWLDGRDDLGSRNAT